MNLAILLLAMFAASPAAAATHRRATPIPLATIAGYASQIAGQPVGIVCDANPDIEGGNAEFPNTIHLDPFVCDALEHPTDPIKNVAYGMLALSHEATHIALWPDPSALDEGIVECSALQNRWQLVRQFHLPAHVADRILSDEVIVHDSIMTGAYRTVC